MSADNEIENRTNTLGKPLIKALKDLILDYSEDMYELAFNILQDAEKAHALVTDILYALWVDGAYKDIEGPLTSYLLTLVRTACEQSLHP